MGFANSSASFTRFRILDPVTDELIREVPDRLRKHAFVDIDDLPELQSRGWVSFEDFLDTEWHEAPPQKGNYLVFSLRVDKRKIPAGVVRKHVAIALRQEKEELRARNKTFISRERKKEIREQVILRLRQRFLPVPGEFNVIWLLEKNEVWFASTQSGMIDLFMEAFLETFDLRLDQLTPYTLAVSMLDEDALLRLDRLEATQFASQDA
ncbi:MAG: recombination-associated protein RdgC [Desulfovibrio sp.]|nr:recombination-associated protein RdgC [Desulfovibrio sp.]